jgi:hypothetical protein
MLGSAAPPSPASSLEHGCLGCARSGHWQKRWEWARLSLYLIPPRSGDLEARRQPLSRADVRAEPRCPFPRTCRKEICNFPEPVKPAWGPRAVSFVELHGRCIRQVGL